MMGNKIRFSIPGCKLFYRISLLLVLAVCKPVEAHKLNTAYLELREETERCDVLLRIPEFGNSLLLTFPSNSIVLTQPMARTIDGAMLKTWSIQIPDGLAEKRIGVSGLRRSDLLVRIHLEDGEEQTLRVPQDGTSFFVKGSPSQLQVAGTYFHLGMVHILQGVDHLLFVLALLILVKGWKKLAGCITMFTVAHSVTLALATLGLVRVPGPPVEAIIALSIVFVACEIVHGQRGHPGITERAPWMVTLIFGLLHGLGFAGALAEVGLPGNAIPMALLFFNGGVEAGQLLFLGVVLTLLGTCRRFKLPMPTWAHGVPPYLIGSVAMFWVVERLSGF
ncbi:MAG: HupE/UreJ family protein [Pontiella sp.]